MSVQASPSRLWGCEFIDFPTAAAAAGSAGWRKVIRLRLRRLEASQCTLDGAGAETQVALIALVAVVGASNTCEETSALEALD